MQACDAYTYYTIGISHMKWGNNLLGGGLCASGAFLGMIQFNFIYTAPFQVKLSQDAIEAETLSMTSRLAKWQRKRSSDRQKEKLKRNQLLYEHIIGATLSTKKKQATHHKK